MTETGDPLNNAVAERINGILKDEYLDCYKVHTFRQTKELLDAVIPRYNKEKPQTSIGNLVPEKVHVKEIKFGKSLWKNYYQKKKIVNQF